MTQSVRLLICLSFIISYRGTCSFINRFLIENASQQPTSINPSSVGFYCCNPCHLSLSSSTSSMLVGRPRKLAAAVGLCFTWLPLLDSNQISFQFIYLLSFQFTYLLSHPRLPLSSSRLSAKSRHPGWSKPRPPEHLPV